MTLALAPSAGSLGPAVASWSSFYATRVSVMAGQRKTCDLPGSSFWQWLKPGIFTTHEDPCCAEDDDDDDLDEEYWVDDEETFF